MWLPLYGLLTNSAILLVTYGVHNVATTVSYGLRGVVYGQYTTANRCSNAPPNAECLYTGLSCGILAI